MCGTDDCRELVRFVQLSCLCFPILHTDISDGGSNSDFNTRVTLLGQLTLEELVQLSIENTVGDELATLGNCSLLGRHDCGCCVGGGGFSNACAIDGVEMLEGDLNFDDNFWVRSFVCGACLSGIYT